MAASRRLTHGLFEGLPSLFVMYSRSPAINCRNCTSITASEDRSFDHHGRGFLPSASITWLYAKITACIACQSACWFSHAALVSRLLHGYTFEPASVTRTW